MPYRLDRSPFYVLTFLLVLCLPQLGAVALQFKWGFRPFAHEPVRVALSWDMFANRTARCVMEFERVMEKETARYLPLRGLGASLEWDVIYDTVEDYRNVGLVLCRQGPGRTRIRLHCFLPNGTETREGLACE